MAKYLLLLVHVIGIIIVLPMRNDMEWTYADCYMGLETQAELLDREFNPMRSNLQCRMERVENSWFATQVRENPGLHWYPTFLFIHTLGLSIVVGVSSVISARVLGFASTITLAPLARLFPLFWFGFLINTISGFGLWVADAVNKTLPGDGNQAPIYAAKLLFVFLGAMCMLMLKKKAFGSPEGGEDAPTEAKSLAVAVVTCWLMAMILGRLIAYYTAILS